MFPSAIRSQQPERISLSRICIFARATANGGEGGIRTPETLSSLHAFQACALSRARPPLRARMRLCITRPRGTSSRTHRFTPTNQTRHHKLPPSSAHAQRPRIRPRKWSSYFFVILPRLIGRPDTPTGLPFSVTLSAMISCLDDGKTGSPPPFDEPLHPTSPVAKNSVATTRIEVRRRVFVVSGVITSPNRLSASIRFPVPPNPPLLPTPITPASLI